MKNILITGGLGMIGSTVAVKLVSAGHNVTIYDASIPRYGANTYNIFSIKDKIEMIHADIRDSNDIELAIKDKDYIFNFAAQLDHKYSNIKTPTYQ